MSAALVTACPRSISASAKTPSVSAEEHIVTFENGFSKWLQAPHTIQMSQGVTFHQDQETLSMDAAIVYLDSDQSLVSAKSLTPVHVFDPDNDLTGLHGLIDFQTHIAKLQNDVVLIAKPSSKDKTVHSSMRSQFRQTATLTCGELLYDYRHKYAQIPGPLTVTQKTRVLTSDRGDYDTTTGIVTLTGHVHGHDIAGNELSGPSAVLNINKGQESVTLYQPTGIFHVKDAPDGPTIDAPDDTPSTGTVFPQTYAPAHAPPPPSDDAPRVTH